MPDFGKVLKEINKSIEASGSTRPRERLPKKELITSESMDQVYSGNLQSSCNNLSFSQYALNQNTPARPHTFCGCLGCHRSLARLPKFVDHILWNLCPITCHYW